MTTLRAIAKKARVSAATIVVHFGDKDELVALLYNEDQRAITEQAYLELSESKGYLDQSIDGFRHYHRYFALYPNFIRAILQTTSLYHPTSMPSRPAGELAMRSSLRASNEPSRLRASGARLQLRRVMMNWHLSFSGIYLTEIRWWLGSGNLDVELGLARLRHALSILQRGLSASKQLSPVKDEPPGRTSTDFCSI